MSDESWLMPGKTPQKQTYKEFCEGLLCRDDIYIYESDDINVLDRFQQYIVISRRPTLIKYITNPDEDLCELAISDAPYVASLIKNLPERLQYDLVKENENYITHIQNPTLGVQKYIIRHHIAISPSMKNIHPMIVREILWREPSYVKHFPSISDEDTQYYLVQKDTELIKYIENPTRTVQEYLISWAPMFAYKMKKFETDLFENFIMEDPNRLEYEFKTELTSQLSDEAQWRVYRYNYKLIKYLPVINKELQFHILEYAPEILDLIHNKCDELTVHRILSNDV